MLQRRLCASMVLPDQSSSGERVSCRRSDAKSIGAVSMAALALACVRLCPLFLLGVFPRRLPPRRSCAAAAMAALEGATFIDADDEERGIFRPSRFSIGGSSLAAFGLLSSPLVKLNEALRLGDLSSSSDSSSLESLSKRPGYLSRIDLVGLGSDGKVSVLAVPVSSMVSMTDLRKLGVLLSEMEPRGSFPMRFRGDAVRGACRTELLREMAGSPPIEGCALDGRAVPVVLLRRSPPFCEGAMTESEVDTVSVRLCSAMALSLRFGSVAGALLRSCLL